MTWMSIRRYFQWRAGFVDHGPCFAVRVGRRIFAMGWGYDEDAPLSWRWQRVETVTARGVAMVHFVWCGFYVAVGNINSKETT